MRALSTCIKACQPTDSTTQQQRHSPVMLMKVTGDVLRQVNSKACPVILLQVTGDVLRLVFTYGRNTLRARPPPFHAKLPLVDGATCEFLMPPQVRVRAPSYHPRCGSAPVRMTRASLGSLCHSRCGGSVPVRMT